jgi:ABC-type lipoprotein release transport system permease subunit
VNLYLSLAWRNIWRNKRRSLIAISSVLFAVVIALATRSMQLGSYQQMIRNVVSFYTGYAQIQAPAFRHSRSLNDSFVLTDTLVQSIARIPHITCTAPRLESFGLISSGTITEGSLILGVAPDLEDRFTGLSRRLTTGDYLGATENGILLAQGLAQNLQVAPGDTVIILSQGYHGVTAAGRFVVVGVVEFPSPELNRGMAYLTLNSAQYLFDAPDRITSLSIMLDNPKRLTSVLNALKERYAGDYAVLSWEEMMPELVQMIEADNASGVIMLFIIYMVIGFGILGTVLMMTMERNREFGMLIAIGMKRSRLRAVVIIESVFLTLIGVLAGILVGIPVLLYFYYHPIRLSGELADYIIRFGFEPILPFSLEPRIFIAQALSVLLIALIASIYPVWRISRIHPVTALRTG